MILIQKTPLVTLKHDVYLHIYIFISYLKRKKTLFLDYKDQLVQCCLGNNYCYSMNQIKPINKSVLKILHYFNVKASDQLYTTVLLKVKKPVMSQFQNNIIIINNHSSHINDLLHIHFIFPSSLLSLQCTLMSHARHTLNNVQKY
jgi:hypothetical protein